MAVIESSNRTHAATCVASEGTRQNDVAQAILAGGGSAVVAAAVKVSEQNHYNRIAASAKANGLEYAVFIEAARTVGAHA
jgi:hypothetical protein